MLISIDKSDEQELIKHFMKYHPSQNTDIKLMQIAGNRPPEEFCKAVQIKTYTDSEQTGKRKILIIFLVDNTNFFRDSAMLSEEKFKETIDDIRDKALWAHAKIADDYIEQIYFGAYVTAKDGYKIKFELILNDLEIAQIKKRHTRSQIAQEKRNQINLMAKK